jgi:hypothetical protein
MKRHLLWIIALVIAAAPVVTDVCGFDCGRERPPDCPLHQQAPHKCAHDHTIKPAALARVSSEASRPLDIAIALASDRASLTPATLFVARTSREHAPPLRSPRTDILRI